MKSLHLDQVPEGVMVYQPQGVPVGVVRIHQVMNGDRPSTERRVLQNGRWSDRHAYKARILYEQVSARGAVWIKHETPA